MSTEEIFRKRRSKQENLDFFPNQEMDKTDEYLIEKKC